MGSIRYIDIFELVRLKLGVNGETSLTQFDRLVADMPKQQLDAVARWSVQGRSTIAKEYFVDIRLVASVMLECQRCLKPFLYRVDLKDELQVVGSEAALEGDDMDVDEVERILGSHRFDLLALLEDELILSLPYVPKHDVCPSAHSSLGQSEEPDAVEVRPSPFAVLSKLKKD